MRSRRRNPDPGTLMLAALGVGGFVLGSEGKLPPVLQNPFNRLFGSLRSSNGTTNTKIAPKSNGQCYGGAIAGPNNTCVCPSGQYWDSGSNQCVQGSGPSLATGFRNLTATIQAQAVNVRIDQTTVGWALSGNLGVDHIGPASDSGRYLLGFNYATASANWFGGRGVVWPSAYVYVVLDGLNDDANYRTYAYNFSGWALCGQDCNPDSYYVAPLTCLYFDAQLYVWDTWGSTYLVTDWKNGAFAACGVGR